MTDKRNRLLSTFAAAVAHLAAGVAFAATAAAQSDGLDFSAWRTMPVFDRGRRMPLESFANVVVREICGRSSPTLDPGDVLHRTAEGTAARAACELVFPDGKPRRFTAPELLYSWLIEPEVWEYVPFLAARHEDLRKDLLHVPLRSRDGSRLKHVSPAQLIEAEAFRRRLGEISEEQGRARQEGREFAPIGVDRYVTQLYQAYALYRLLTYDPSAEIDIDSNRAFGDKLLESHNLWVEASPRAGPHGPQSAPELEQSHQEVRQAFEQLAGLVRASTFTAEQADPLIVEFGKACDRFARLSEDHQHAVFADPKADESLRTMVQRRAATARQMAETAGQLHRALYDVGRAVRLAPGLDPEALRADRDLGDQRPPWLSIQTLLFGTDALLAGMPRPKLEAVRETYERMRTAYLDRRNPQRAEEFAGAMRRFAAAVRELGEAVEPLRHELDIAGDEDDRQRILAETAYPAAGFNRAELHYNRIKPFLWSWVVCLMATVCAALSFAVFRRLMFWASVAVLILAQGIIAYGLALRTYITGYTAVTNMFETVVFLAYTVALLGVWFTLVPLLWPGIVAAWRLTAIPAAIRAVFTGTRREVGSARQHESERQQAAAREDNPQALQGPAEPSLPPEEHPPASAAVPIVQWLLLLPQIGLMAGLVIALTMLPYGSGGRAIFRLLPNVDSGQTLPTTSDLLAWIAGLAVLVPTVWLTPRILFATVLSLGTIPYQWACDGASAAIAEAFSRRVFVLVGAAVGFVAGVIAYQAPIFNRDIQALQPILRDNFWLTMHVLSITASYGAGALAWGQANIALGYYLFGRYRDPSPDTAGGMRRKPPEVCSWLAGFIYRAVQVAVLLLTVGTILGALWADVAWGRFWSWDAKEVWSLICILAYMIILHGRYIGWFGDFGLAAGAVLGLTTILMTWYGVNYVFGSGLHSYGGGAGGQYEVLTFVAANWLFLAAAAVRYLAETRRG
ncbi:MAG: cytochrome c biogenesis protein CcsA [Thermoguttaceae bacterium]|jgi:ABC-type transport system involved in cytochrome c biogenesis permease subunit|nr:cytochrome c biogenesis protein CcsA [Thermoguttaceae bacterium]